MTTADTSTHARVQKNLEYEPDQDRLLEALQDVAYGSVAGAVGKLIEYPFDTVKVRLQSQRLLAPLQYTGPLDCFRQSIQKDGIVQGLYRGISAPIVGAAIETSSLFFSYNIAQNVLHATAYNSSSPLPLGALCVCGAASGAFTSLLLTPIELVKCKMQVPQQSHAFRPGIASIATQVLKQHGPLGFWHGQLGTLIRETGGSAAWFGSYEAVLTWFQRRIRRHHDHDVNGLMHDDMALPIWQRLLAGATAGMSYNFMFYPADTIKSRMQTEEVLSAERGTFIGTCKLLWKEQGIRGMYRGCGITVARSAPSSAVIFTIYEALKNRR